jgi:hypothetical protein
MEWNGARISDVHSLVLYMWPTNCGGNERTVSRVRFLVGALLVSLDKCVH